MISASLPGPLQRYLDGWVESRNPPSRDAITLHNRRVYILPTRFGYLFAMMLMFLFLAAINYQNSMAFVLTFMLASLGIISLWYTHKNLLGISVDLQTPRPVFCGEHCELRFEFSHPNQVTRYAIGIQYAQLPPVYVKLEPAAGNTAVIKLPTQRRGQFRPRRVTVFTRYPTGLFHAWGWLQFEQPLLVYPRPLDKARLQQSLVEQHEGRTSTSTIEGDDFAGLREHRVGESLRHVSWKAYAQGRGLLTKTFQGHARPSLWIDWQLLTQGSQEHKLSFMAALVLAAEAEQQKYGLRLPGKTIEQDFGNAHKHECLHALATFRLGGDIPEFPLKATEANLPIRSISMETSNRNSVFAVCFCFLFSIAPHFRHLPLWVSGIVIAALTWRCLQNIGKLSEVPKWLLIPMVVAGGISVFAEYWTVVGRDAGLALLTVMTAFKFLESRLHRDLLILVFLCYFLIATHFLFSQSIPTAAMMFVTLIVITSTLVILNQRESRVSVRQLLATGSRLVVLSVPLMLILFVLVPRVPGPLWGLTNEQRGGITGLSDNMSPGKISNLIRSNEVAFRVEFDGAVPAQNDLYWRGPVMPSYNGYRWSQWPQKPMRRLESKVSDDEINYTVTLEPNGEHWLLALDIPTKLVEDSVITREYQLVSKKKVNDLLRYSMVSRLPLSIGVNDAREYLDIASAYPPDFNPRTIDYGRELAERLGDTQAIVDEVLDLFRREDFYYTLNPPLLGRDTVDEFLFGTRRGFCEHYAGSFALVMRAAGIPARIVTGYQGGEYNKAGNYLIVRQSDAHAWTEVWFEERGWVRVDPTAAVSPNRIEGGIDNALADELPGFRIQNRNPIFGELLYGWDNLQHSWNDWVLNYDDRKQRSFLQKLDIGIDNWSDMVIAMVILLAVVSGSFWAIAWYRERPPRPPPYERQFNRLLRRLARRGLDKKPSEDSRAFLARVATPAFEQREQLARVVDLYNRIKYGRNGDSPQARKQLGSLISSLRV